VALNVSGASFTRAAMVAFHLAVTLLLPVAEVITFPLTDTSEEMGFFGSSLKK
jgi:hypothetical protein